MDKDIPIDSVIADCEKLQGMSTLSPEKKVAVRKNLEILRKLKKAGFKKIKVHSV